MQKIVSLISNQKEEIVAFTVALLCLFMAVAFPANGEAQILSRIIFFLIILPALYIKLILKKSLYDFGLNFSHKKKGFLWAAIMLAASFLSISVLFYFFNLSDKYVLPGYVIDNFWIFTFYELLLINFTLFVFEFFFRGFVQTMLERHINAWSPIAQFAIFIIFLLLTQKSAWQYAPLLILSLTGGIVTYKSKSFLFSYIMGIIFILSVDLYVIHLLK